MGAEISLCFEFWGWVKALGAGKPKEKQPGCQAGVLGCAGGSVVAVKGDGSNEDPPGTAQIPLWIPQSHLQLSIPVLL